MLFSFPSWSFSCGAVWSVVQRPSTTNCRRANTSATGWRFGKQQIAQCPVSVLRGHAAQSRRRGSRSLFKGHGRQKRGDERRAQFEERRSKPQDAGPPAPWRGQSWSRAKLTVLARSHPLALVSLVITASCSSCSNHGLLLRHWRCRTPLKATGLSAGRNCQQNPSRIRVVFEEVRWFCAWRLRLGRLLRHDAGGVWLRKRGPPHRAHRRSMARSLVVVGKSRAGFGRGMSHCLRGCRKRRRCRPLQTSGPLAGEPRTAEHEGDRSPTL